MAALDSRLGGEHMPRRPQWDCEACEQPWPCDPARVRLAEEFGTNRVNLSMYVSGLLDAALEELPTADTADLYDRFVASLTETTKTPRQPSEGLAGRLVVACC
ncbi:hypothetical protein ACIBEF_22290 [Micromonospora sp. NPDC050795]|uniref:hypothetical protein n=1 Tax=Micromonospora sp. NPDC050795 TaxID=3364282 RepID=UPI0037A4002F